MSSETHSGLDRRQAVARLLKVRDKTIVVSGLGAATYDVAAAGDHPLNFYLWGAMGGAAMVGMGIALARPRTPVLVVTGDGEMIMGFGSFAVMAKMAPANLTVVVLDNGLYGETGGQPTHTAGKLDLAKAAVAAGIEDARTLTTFAGIDELSQVIHAGLSGPTVAVIKIGDAPHDKVIPMRDGAVNKARLRAALGLVED